MTELSKGEGSHVYLSAAIEFRLLTKHATRLLLSSIFQTLINPSSLKTTCVSRCDDRSSGKILIPKFK